MAAHLSSQPPLGVFPLQAAVAAAQAATCPHACTPPAQCYGQHTPDMMCTFACKLIYSDGDMLLGEDWPKDQPLDHVVVGPLAYPLPVPRTSHQDVFTPRTLYQDVLNQV